MPAEQPGFVDFSPQLKSCWEPTGQPEGAVFRQPAREQEPDGFGGTGVREK